MDEILKKLDEINSRLTSIEKSLNRPSFSNSFSYIKPVTVTAPPPPPLRQTSTPIVIQDTKPPEDRKKIQDLESKIGKWWFAAIGGIAVLLGVGFFLKYAFDEKWISENGRIILTIIAGMIFIVLGEFLRSRLTKYSHILTGVGIALLYLATFSAFDWYKKIDQVTAFSFMSLITVFGVALAIRVDALSLAIFSTLGGFMTPLILSTTVANDIGRFTYLIILNVGILGVAFFKKWNHLTVIGFIATIVNFLDWHEDFYDPSKLFFTIFILSIFFILYVWITVTGNIMTQKLSTNTDLAILTVNSAWFALWIYDLLKPGYEHTLGFIAAGLGAIYIFAAYLVKTLHSEDKQMVLFLGTIALVFLTLAIPLQLDQNAITIAWIVEAAVLFVLGSTLKNSNIKAFAIGVYAIAMIRMFAIDDYNLTPQALTDFTPVFNKRFFTYLMATISAAFILFSSVKINPADDKDELETKNNKQLQGVFGAIIILLVFFNIQFDLHQYFRYKIYVAEQATHTNKEDIDTMIKNIEMGKELPGDIIKELQPNTAIENIRYKQQVTYSVFWILYAIILIIIGIIYSNKPLRWFAIGLLVIAILKVFFVDLAELPVLYRIIPSIVLGIILMIISYLYFRQDKSNPEQPEKLNQSNPK